MKDKYLDSLKGKTFPAPCNNCGTVHNVNCVGDTEINCACGAHLIFKNDDKSLSDINKSFESDVNDIFK
ncbi:hypothetical protein [Photobacterium damselae]|uniref:hypothetical protein n=1 Tax=Photobacterium damselae TaxID=38293 RepID=UPI0010FEF6C3|nr:hypothetical protein [Photobacterium damselae]TLS80660.1 hypothetical protein FD721_00540 [Photobacterium damselae subsp. damselae]